MIEDRLNNNPAKFQANIIYRIIYQSSRSPLPVGGCQKKPGLDRIKFIQFLFIHLVQVPWLNVPWWLPQSINFLKSPLWSINEYVLYTGHKETSSPVIFAKFGNPHRNRVFLAWSQVFGLILRLRSRGSVLRVSRWRRDIWLLQ